MSEVNSVSVDDELRSWARENGYEVNETFSKSARTGSSADSEQLADAHQDLDGRLLEWTPANGSILSARAGRPEQQIRRVAVAALLLICGGSFIVAQIGGTGKRDGGERATQPSQPWFPAELSDSETEESKRLRSLNGFTDSQKEHIIREGDKMQRVMKELERRRRY